VSELPEKSLSANRDFRRLWLGLAVSQFGSAVGSTALPVVAVGVLHASTIEVAVLAALGSVTVGISALPVGTFAEFRRKRPVMIGADLLRFAALASVPVAGWLQLLTFGQLCLVAMLSAFGQLLFQTASQAHLVALVSREQLVEATGRLQSTTWLSLAVGPALGGALVSGLSATTAMLLDGLSFLASAAAVLRLRTAEPAPPIRSPDASPARSLGKVSGGLRFVLGRPDLRRLLLSWLVFAGCMGLASPLTSLLYLRTLRFTPWQYGLILGLPSLAGFAGARLTGRAGSRFGALRVLRWAGLLRVPGLVLIALAPAGGLGVTQCCLGFAAVLLFSSLANSAMTEYRQLATPEPLLSRVAALWSLAGTAGQPVFVLLGGLLASRAGVRAGLAAAAGGALVAGLMLPSSGRKSRNSSRTGISESIQALGRK